MRLSHPSWRWLMIALAFLATAINYLDRQSFSVAAPVLIDQFRMNHATYGRVVFAFMLAYTIANGISGPLLDRLGTRRGFSFDDGVVVCRQHAEGAGARALVPGLLPVPAGGGGGGQLAGQRQSGGGMVSGQRTRARFRNLQQWLLRGSDPGASAHGGVIASLRMAAGFCLDRGDLGFLWIAIWLSVYHTPEAVRHEVARPTCLSWRLFRTRFVWSFTLAKSLLDPVWYFYIFWFPEYLNRARHFSMSSIGKYAWIPLRRGRSGESVRRRGFGLDYRTGLFPYRGSQGRSHAFCHR